MLFNFLIFLGGVFAGMSFICFLRSAQKFYRKMFDVARNWESVYFQLFQFL